jgi:hypothetical protein
MYPLRRLFLGFAVLSVFTGCTQQPQTMPTKITDKKTSQNKQENIVKNNSTKLQKHNETCKQYFKVMKFASHYIEEEFKKGYFSQKDAVGAKAQLFLIQNKSQTLFAKNINAALDSYFLKYKLAQKEKCNLDEFKIPPLQKIQNTIKEFEKQTKENK